MFKTKIQLISSEYQGAYSYALLNMSKEARGFWLSSRDPHLSFTEYLQLIDNYFRKDILSETMLKLNHPNIPKYAYLGNFSNSDLIREAKTIFDLLDIITQNHTFGSSAFAIEEIYSYILIASSISGDSETELWRGSLGDFSEQVNGGFIQGSSVPSGAEYEYECLKYLYDVQLTGIVETEEPFNIQNLSIKEEDDSLAAGCIQLSSFSYNQSSIPMKFSYQRFAYKVLDLNAIQI